MVLQNGVFNGVSVKKTRKILLTCMVFLSDTFVVDCDFVTTRITGGFALREIAREPSRRLTFCGHTGRGHFFL